MARANNSAVALTPEVLAELLRRRDHPQPTDTQARLIAAALELFAEHGYAACTTAAIASRAGVTEKTLFTHFPRKQDLLVSTVIPALQQLFEPLVFRDLRTVLRAEMPSLRDALTALLRDRVAFARGNPAVLKLMAQALLLHAEFRAAFVAYWSDEVLPVALSMLERARSRGEFSTQMQNVPDGSILRAVVSTTVGYVLQRVLFLPNGEWDDDREIDTMVTILLSGIGAQEMGA